MQAIGLQPERTTDGAALHHERNRSAQTTLYQLVQQHAACVMAYTEGSTRAELPRFIKHEFDNILECGSLARGEAMRQAGADGVKRYRAA